jgi:hypothetical protein
MLYEEIVVQLDAAYVALATLGGREALLCLLKRCRESRFYRGQLQGREDTPGKPELLRALFEAQAALLAAGGADVAAQ